MTEQELEITIAGAGVQALLFRPDDIGVFPGVVFLTDIWGIRPANIAMAKRLSDKGFAVLVPNAFWRYSRIQPDGFETGDEQERHKRLMDLFASLTAPQQEEDGAAYVDFLLAQKGVAPGKVGVVGYCFSGMVALRTAAAAPDKVAAAASFHGGMLVTDRPDSPHKVLPRVKARLYFGHAVEDRSMTAAQIETLEGCLRDWHGAFQSETYEGALHGWTVPGRDVYNELQAERAFEKEVELFDATLKEA
ncbi:MAG TPA: dienelactone hydrolase family protein [Rhizomicrobium sp.]